MVIMASPLVTRASCDPKTVTVGSLATCRTFKPAMVPATLNAITAFSTFVKDVQLFVSFLAGTMDEISFTMGI